MTQASRAYASTAPSSRLDFAVPSLDEIPFLKGLSIPFLSETTWAGNSLLQWLIALGVLLTVALVVKVAVNLVVRRLRRIAERTSTSLDDIWVKVVDATSWFGYLALGLAVARPMLKLSGAAQSLTWATTTVLAGIQVALWAQTLLSVALEEWASREDSAKTSTAAAAMRFLGRLIIWSGLTLIVLSNLGIEITTVVAGLGVGGVAAALAVQNILGDLFAGLSMYFDRPFDIGDFIIVDDVLGNVQKIGLRTTRIDSLGGEKIVYPNGELTKRCIRNYAWMKERRIVFAFGIEYNVSPDVLDRARDLAQQAVEEQSEVRFDRAHFKSYGAYSLDYEVVYYVPTGDYNVYMDKQHAINVSLYRKFKGEGIPFAFPTRTIYTRTEDAQLGDMAKHDSNGRAPHSKGSSRSTTSE